MARPARLRSRALACSLLSCGLAAAGAAPVADPAATAFRPDTTARNAPGRSGDTWLAQAPSYAVRLRLIDDAERLEFLRKTTGFVVDPFASHPDTTQRFLTFLLELENQARGPVVFEPRSCWLVTPRPQVVSPIGLEDLRTTFNMVAQEFPAAYERARPAILEASHTLAPGESLAGLLVYPAPGSRTQRFRVDLRFVLPEGEQVMLSAPYRRPKPKR